MSAPSELAATAPPYTPGFGVVPHAVAGREHLLVRHEAALRRGPRDPFFTQAILGDRGVGKTVFLAVLAARVIERHRWSVLRYQVRKGGATIGEILGEVPKPPGRRWGPGDLTALERQVSVELNTGLVRLAGSTASTPAPLERSAPISLARALSALATAARRRERGVMLAIDEAQALSGDHLGQLGMTAQTVAHGAELPVAITLAGTPELSRLLLNSGSFLERMPCTELGMLSRDETRLALLEPANALGATWDEDAPATPAGASSGYPYFVQLAGYHAWQHAAPGPGGRIGQIDAGVAALAVQHDADRMFQDRFERLGPAQQRYLRAVVELSAGSGREPVLTREVAERLGRSPTELTRVRDTLIYQHHLLRSGARGELEFAFPRFAAWLRTRDHLRPASAGTSPSAGTPSARRRPSGARRTRPPRMSP
jgi:hypothetical protein